MSEPKSAYRYDEYLLQVLANQRALMCAMSVLLLDRHSDGTERAIADTHFDLAGQIQKTSKMLR